MGWWYGKKIFNYRSLNQNDLNIKANFDDLITYIIISLIIGGRLGYIIFYNFNFYLDNPIEILMLWHGGMSFHGGLLGVIIGTSLFARNKGIKPLFLLDIVACVAPIGLFFGRLANFINSELYGKPTDVSWGFKFPLVDNVVRHPSQLYEAILEGIILFIILNIFIKKSINGYCSSLFLIFYGIFRIIAEYFREPDIQVGHLLGFLSMGALLSSIMVVSGIIVLGIIKKNEIYK
jgi:phosphatidylglycerol:prolipoprotein diacylglycerol transferase